MPDLSRNRSPNALGMKVQTHRILVIKFHMIIGMLNVQKGFHRLDLSEVRLLTRSISQLGQMETLFN